jgi:S1-C subfamily serine protease
MNCLRYLIATLLLLDLSAKAQENALLFYDEGNLGPEFVKVVQASRIERGPVSLIVVYSNQRKTILNKEVKEILNLPNKNRDRVTEADFLEIKTFVDKLETRKQNHPLTVREISQIQDSYKTFVQGHENGLAFVGGNWIPKNSINLRMQPNGQPGNNSVKLTNGNLVPFTKITGTQSDGIRVMTDSGIIKILYSEMDPSEAEKFGYKPSMTQPIGDGTTESVDPNLPLIGFLNNEGKLIQENQAEVETKSASEIKPWKPKSLADVAKCVLIIKGDNGTGTGFLCNNDGSTYIYTNAHVISGNTTIQIVNRDGVFLNDIAYFELSEKPYGGLREFSSGDLARIRLRDYREEALELSEIGSSVAEGSSIAAIGNSDGANVVVTLDGEITGVGPDVLEISSEIVPGNSGGPVVDAESFQVLGVATFLKKGSESIWAKDTRFEAVRRFALRTDKEIGWKRTKIFDFLKECYVIDKLERDVRLISLINLLDFKADGIYYDRDLGVEGEYLVGDIISENEGHPLVKNLLELNSVLKANSENVDNVFLNYVTYLSNGGRAMAKNRSDLDEAGISWFNKNHIERLGLLEAHDEKMRRFAEVVLALREHL